VIHTASPTHGRTSDIFYKVNVQGTKTLLQACVDSGVKSLVFTSSASVVFDGSDLKGVDETTPYCTKFIDAYNETKALAEKEVLEWNGRQVILN
jgi:sterol-4alpha-carboxylate 3-dehydrogenase (decarboxylating)